MYEHMGMFESNLMVKNLVLGRYNYYNDNPALYIADPSIGFGSRSNILPLAMATMMWWVSTENGVYTRSELESKFHTLLGTWKREILDNIPAMTGATTPTQRGYKLTG
jgi:hypothetical protein